MFLRNYRTFVFALCVLLTITLSLIALHNSRRITPGVPTAYAYSIHRDTWFCGTNNQKAVFASGETVASAVNRNDVAINGGLLTAAFLGDKDSEVLFVHSPYDRLMSLWAFQSERWVCNRELQAISGRITDCIRIPGGPENLGEGDLLLVCGFDDSQDGGVSGFFRSYTLSDLKLVDEKLTDWGTPLALASLNNDAELVVGYGNGVNFVDILSKSDYSVKKRIEIGISQEVIAVTGIAKRNMSEQVAVCVYTSNNSALVCLDDDYNFAEVFDLGQGIRRISWSPISKELVLGSGVFRESRVVVIDVVSGRRSELIDGKCNGVAAWTTEGGLTAIADGKIVKYSRELILKEVARGRECRILR